MNFPRFFIMVIFLSAHHNLGAMENFDLLTYELNYIKTNLVTNPHTSYTKKTKKLKSTLRELKEDFKNLNTNLIKTIEINESKYQSAVFFRPLWVIVTTIDVYQSISTQNLGPSAFTIPFGLYNAIYKPYQLEQEKMLLQNKVQRLHIIITECDECLDALPKTPRNFSDN